MHSIKPRAMESKNFQIRMRRDGMKFLAGLEEAEVGTALVPENRLPAPKSGKLNHGSGHNLGTLCKFVAKKGLRFPATP